MNNEPVRARDTSVADRVVATHMMIRVALTGIALAIVLSVLYQMMKDDCPLTSISAYWYTDARAIFAGGLMVISICLIAYSGGTWTENLLLNLAGVLAPIVAIAPTTIGKQLDKDCLGTRAPGSYDSSATTNGLTVYFVVLFAGALFTIFASRALRGRIAARKPGLSPKEKTISRIGAGVALAVPVVLLAWALIDDDFPQHAHFPSAATMFVFLALVAGSRSEWGSRLTKRWDLYRDTATLPEALRRTFPYSKLNLGVAILMLATLLLAGVNILLEKRWHHGWDYGVITAEFTMLGLFLVFWLAQTIQMRDLTHIGPSDPGPPPAGEAEDEAEAEPPSEGTTEVMA
jgi:hypothetical protein